jgi:cbb3-type cytochrome oxidase subunit 3
MRLTDIMSNAGLSIYAEIGLILFVIAFIVIAVRIFQPSRKRSLDQASRLPLDDGQAKTPSSKEPEA